MTLTIPTLLRHITTMRRITKSILDFTTMLHAQAPHFGLFGALGYGALFLLGGLRFEWNGGGGGIGCDGTFACSSSGGHSILLCVGRLFTSLMLQLLLLRLLLVVNNVSCGNILTFFILSQLLLLLSSSINKSKIRYNTLTTNKANTNMPSTNTLLPHRTTLTPTHQTPLILLHGPMSNTHSTLLSILGTIGDGTGANPCSVACTDSLVHDAVGAGGVGAGWLAIFLLFFLGVVVDRGRRSGGGLCSGRGNI
mmetsp:Transcript_2678/g.3963  ORF Transcript_2678/g.3963 Transcript_2678/m.3963 type:complete len:252 (-) Transcript_2678:54-809(-)